jgi:precorrin-8X/cobalt-precorrin-8 methylmutase
MAVNWRLNPKDIEAQSFAIIDEEAGAHELPSAEWSLVRRLIHTSADFDYIKDIFFSPFAVLLGVKAIQAGAAIITDTRMALSGINRKNLAPFGNELFCFIDHPRTLELAKSGTRSQAAVDAALELTPDPNKVIFAIGNAPTALCRLLEVIESKPDLKPKLILGFPVGFVNALESKRELKRLAPVPFITNLSRKGGSNVVAAAVNALALLAGAASA